MNIQKQLKVFTLTYDKARNAITPHVAYLNTEHILEDMYKIIGCTCVACTGIEVNDQYYDVWSDDEALLVEKPVPNLYINDDIVIFGNLLITKTYEDGEIVGLDDGEPQLLYSFAQIQYPKLLKWLKNIRR